LLQIVGFFFKPCVISWSDRHTLYTPPFQAIWCITFPSFWSSVIYYFYLYFILVNSNFYLLICFFSVVLCILSLTAYYSASPLISFVLYLVFHLYSISFFQKVICFSSWHARYIVNNSILTVYIQPACPHFRQATLVFISWLTSRESHAWLLPLMEVFNLLHKGDSSRHYTAEISCFFDIRSFHHLYCL